MENNPDGADGPREDQEDARPPVHYSTGRLTRRQAETVNRWRARLAEDKPLPGQEPVSEAARLIMGLDDRPRASCSDVIAAAARELLAAGPDPMEVARYADASWQAQRIAGARGGGGKAAPVYPPVSWYLPAELADTHTELRWRAREAAARARQDVDGEATKRYPQPDQGADRHTWYLRELRARDIPVRGAQVPRGTLARMAIDAWAHRSPDRAVAAAVDYAAEVHQQPHRGRRDMYELRP